MKIVLDTNVLVSGILFAGHPREILGSVARGELTNFTSPDLLREAEAVLLRPKFGLKPEQVSAILALLRETFETVHPTRRIRIVVADPGDDKVMEAASAAGAEVIVSGDRHLLEMTAWEGIRILSPAQFMDETG